MSGGPVTLSRVDPKVLFSPEEGRCLEVLAALLGRAEKAPTATVRASTWRRELCEAGARRMARALTAYMAHEEGYRDRTFLRDGHRVTGRVWSAELGAGFALRFNAPSYSLWRVACERFAAFASVGSPRATKGQGALQESIETRGSGTGDWGVFAIAHEHLKIVRLPNEEHELILRRLRVGSPLALLLNPDPASTRPELSNAFGRLINPVNVRLIECVETRLVRRWTSSAASAWESRSAPAEATRRWVALDQTLRAWLAAIDDGRRLDLARSLLRFVADFVGAVVKEEPEAVRASLSRSPGLRSVEEREALLAAVGGVLDLGRSLLRRRDELSLERYGDDRYEEAQVYVRDADRILTPARRRVVGLARALSGELG